MSFWWSLPPPPSTLYYYFFFFCFFFFAFLFCFRKKLTSLLVLFYQEVLLPWKRESTRNEDRIEIPLGARSFFMSLAPIPLLNFSETFSGFFFGGWLSKPFSAIRIFFLFFFLDWTFRGEQQRHPSILIPEGGKKMNGKVHSIFINNCWETATLRPKRKKKIWSF